MEELITRFAHIAEQIFQQLDDKSLTNCREVAKSWQKFIDDRYGNSGKGVLNCEGTQDSMAGSVNQATGLPDLMMALGQEPV